MGRLAGRSLPSRLGALPSRLAAAPQTEQDRSRRRDAEQGWRRWYKTSRWQKLRWSVLVRDRFTCQWPGCGRIEADTSQLVADHRIPHRGDPDRFWDQANLQCLCKPCHDRRKQAAERRDGL